MNRLWSYFLLIIVQISKCYRKCPIWVFAAKGLFHHLHPSLIYKGEKLNSYCEIQDVYHHD